SFVLKMVFQEFSFWGFLILVMVFSAGYWILIKRLKNKYFHHQHQLNPLTKVIWFVGTGMLLVFGFRGKINFNMAPISPTDAYFSDYSIANQTALNPVFTFLKS